jgi:hypothetical protein
LLTVYLDESGTHDSSPSLAVAGYIASAEKWARFDRCWKHFVDEEGISFLHMTDLENRKEQFKNYKDSDKLRVLKRAHFLIGDIGAIGFGSALNRADFREVVMGNAEAFKKIGSSYCLCASTVVHQIASWARSTNHQEPIHYVFGDITNRIDGNKVKHEMLDLFGQYKRNKFYQKMFFIAQPPSFMDMKTVRPLQAADLQAYELSKDTNRRIGMSEGRGVRRSLLNLLRVVAVDNQGYWDRASLQELCRRVIEDEVDHSSEESMRKYLESD